MSSHSLSHLCALVEAVRVFRNEPALETLGDLRGTPGYIGLCDAWDDARDFLEPIQPLAAIEVLKLSPELADEIRIHFASHRSGMKPTTIDSAGAHLPSAVVPPPRAIGEVVISTSPTGESGFQMIKWAADAPSITVGMKVYAASETDAPPASNGKLVKVYLVATGETHEGQETYTRHDVRPPLCDAEVLLSAEAMKG